MYNGGEMESTKKPRLTGNIVNNLLWRFAEKMGVKVIGLFVNLLLARLLAPSDYGLIALVSIIIQILYVFIDSGLTNALIQKRNTSNRDFDSVFVYNILLSLLLYILLWIFAPYFALLYEYTQLTQIVRAFGTIIIIYGFKNVQQAYISKHMLHNKFFFATLGATAISSVVGICMALSGYGIWAIVAQQLTYALVDTLILWITVEWRPRISILLPSLVQLLHFGWYILTSKLIDSIYNKIRQLLIGKIYSAESLAFYSKGQEIPSIIVSSINTPLDSILLPALSEEQDNKGTVKIIARRTIQVSSFLLWPILIGIIAAGEPLVRLILTEKWMPCLPYLRLFCVYYAMYPIHTTNLNTIMALGKSNYFVRMEFVKKGIGIVILLVTFRLGVLPMACGVCFEGIITTYINAYPNRKLLNYSFFEQIHDVLPTFKLTLLMGGCVYGLSFIGLCDWLTILLQIFAGMTIYLVGAVLFHNPSYSFLSNIIKSRLRKSKR